MKRDPKRLARMARAHDSLARLLEARLLAEEAKARDMAAGRLRMEASAQHIPMSLLPAALRSLTEAEARQKSLERNVAILRRQRLDVEGRCLAISARIDMAEAERARKWEEERMLDNSHFMAKVSGKQDVLK